MAFNDIDKITEREVTKDFVERLSIGKDFANPDYNNLNGENNILFNAETKLKDSILAKTIMSLPSDYINNISDTKTSYCTYESGNKYVRLYISPGAYLYKIIHENTGFNVTNSFIQIISNGELSERRIYLDSEIEIISTGCIVICKIDTSISSFKNNDIICIGFENGCSYNIIQIQIYCNDGGINFNIIDNPLLGAIPTEIEEETIVIFRNCDNLDLMYCDTEGYPLIPTSKNDPIFKSSNIKIIDKEESNKISGFNTDNCIFIENIDDFEEDTIYNITLKYNKKDILYLVTPDDMQYLIYNGIGNFDSTVRLLNDNGKYVIINNNLLFRF